MPSRAESLPGSFTWSSSGPLTAPKPDAAHPIVSIKDPTVFRYENRWYVYATTANTSGTWSLAHPSFTDWSQAAAAPQTFDPAAESVSYEEARLRSGDQGLMDGSPVAHRPARAAASAFSGPVSSGRAGVVSGAGPLSSASFFSGRRKASRRPRTNTGTR